MIKNKIIDKLIELGKRNKMFKIISLALIFVVSFFFNLLKDINVNKNKIGAVCLALLIVAVYSKTILNFDKTIVAADFDDDGMYEGIILNDSVSVNDEYSFDKYSEPKDFMTNEAAELSTFDLNDWKYVLVNKDNPITEPVQIETINYCGYKVDSRIYEDLLDMFEAGKEEGMRFTMASGFRTENDQIFLFNRKVNQYKKSGLSQEDAEREASMIVTPPNTSEHQTGLAVDILSASHNKMDLAFGNTDEGKWLAEHCCEYGFILRYPKGCEDITQIMYEPWHFRYVGVEAASYIKEKNITYEEFYELITKVNEQ